MILVSTQKQSTKISWDSRYEEFSFLCRCWNIRTAKEIIQAKPRNVEEITVANFEPLLSRTPHNSKIYRMGVGIDLARLDSDEIDLSIPVIIAKLDKDNYLIIDGWHRLAKAVKQDLETLPCVILTQSETKKCEIK